MSSSLGFQGVCKERKHKALHAELLGYLLALELASSLRPNVSERASGPACGSNNQADNPASVKQRHQKHMTETKCCSKDMSLGEMHPN